MASDTPCVLNGNLRMIKGGSVVHAQRRSGPDHPDSHPDSQAERLLHTDTLDLDSPWAWEEHYLFSQR